MGTSQKTFDQVRSILGKLDARIDNLRQRRSEPVGQAAPLGQTTAGTNAGTNAVQGGYSINGSANGTTGGPANAAIGGTQGVIGPNTYIGGPAPQPSATQNAATQTQPAQQVPSQGVAPARSPYGRATPIRPLSA